MPDTYQPYNHDFINEHAVIQGMYFERAFELPATPDITGMNIKAQVKKSPGATDVMIEFKLSDNTVVISGGTPNILTLKQDGDKMNIPVGHYVYDVIAYNDVTDPIPLMKGIFPIQQKVTNF